MRMISAQICNLKFLNIEFVYTNCILRWRQIRATFYDFSVFCCGGYPKMNIWKSQNIELSLRFLEIWQKWKSNYSDVLYPEMQFLIFAIGVVCHLYWFLRRLQAVWASWYFVKGSRSINMNVSPCINILDLNVIRLGFSHEVIWRFMVKRKQQQCIS